MEKFLENVGQSSRTPPAHVRRQLRRESGFVCAHPNCSEPYLEYHHFDPPWHIEQHHRSSGMIALCPTHHSRAETWPVEQLRKWKGKEIRDDVKAQIGWRRETTFFIAGNYLTRGCTNLLEVRGNRIIWFTNDEEGQTLLNFDLRDRFGNSVFQMRDNDWIAHPRWEDVEVPPQGRALHLKSEALELQLDLRFGTQTPRSLFEGLSMRDSPEELGRMSGLASIDLEALVCSMTCKLIWPERVIASEKGLTFRNFNLGGGFSSGCGTLISLR